MYKILIDQNILDDISNAKKWYNLQQNGLGKRFTDSIKLSIDSLKINPFLYAIRYDDIRCCLIDTFPYLIHYQIFESEKKVVVTGVFHTSRNPEIWEKE